MKINSSFMQDTLKTIPTLSLDTLHSYGSDSIIPISTNYSTSKSNKSTEQDNQITKSDSIQNTPNFCEIKINHKSLISNYKETFYESLSVQKICYITKNEDDNIISSVVLNEGIKTSHSTEAILTINEKGKNNTDWVLIPLLFGLFTMALVITFYRKYLGQLLERIVYYFASSNNRKSKSIPFQSLTVILDFLFIISFSMLADLVVKKLGLYTPPIKYPFFVFLLVGAFLLFLRIFRWTIYNLTALFSNQTVFFKDLFSNSTLYTRTLGVFLLPIVFLISYTTGFITTILIYFAVIITIIFLIIRIIRLFKVFIVGGFSIFYFILYLCALEIAPLLIIWKEVNSR